MSLRKQPRDDKGRFLSWDGTRNRKYNVQDVRNAFFAGIDDTSRFLTRSKRFDMYLKLNKLD